MMMASPKAVAVRPVAQAVTSDGVAIHTDSHHRQALDLLHRDVCGAANTLQDAGSRLGDWQHLIELFTENLYGHVGAHAGD